VPIEGLIKAHRTSRRSKGAGRENFPVASRLLPAKVRPHVMVFYAFARAADEVADAPHREPDLKRNQLHAMALQLGAGDADPYPHVYALWQSLGTTQVSSRHAQDLLTAFVWDVDHPRTPTWAALMAYCALSAAPVGRYLIDLTGGIDGEDYRPSDALCAALQVLNHVQDIKEDFLNLERVYLPQDWLLAEGVRDADLHGETCSPALRRVIDQTLDGVDTLLVQAWPMVRSIRSKALALEAAGILAIAQSLSSALRRHDPLAGRVQLSKAHMAVRFVLGAGTGVFGGAPHKATGSSFYWALRLMPTERREAMFRIYAFCRDVDDIADGPLDAATKRVRLDQWRSGVESLYDAQEPDERVLALKGVVETYHLDKTDLLDVIDGMQSDAHDSVRIADEAAFDVYLDRVASAVGRLSNKVFTISGPAAESLAHHLGRALQITNILRDLNEDAERNRLYLPLSVLRAQGIYPDQPHAVLAHERLPDVLSLLAAQAQDHYAQARVALLHLDRSKTRPARIMMGVYERLLRHLQRRGLARTDVKVSLGRFEKIGLVLRYGLFE
jgi:squalene synthase HpnD/squalene synthase HpnC